MLPKKPNQQLPSTEQKQEILPLHTPEQSTDTLLRSCKVLPLSIFKECYCNNDYSGLGKGTKDELQAAWNEILFEYSSLIDSENSQYLFSISKKISLLSCDISFIEGAIVVLKAFHDQEIVDILRQMGYPLIEGYKEKDLDRIVSLAKTLVYEFNELQDEMNKIQTVASGKAQTESDFDKTIALLSKFQGYAIRPKETTVTEFCGIFNLFLAHNKQDHGSG